jgi:hypothetical protein
MEHHPWNITHGVTRTDTRLAGVCSSLHLSRSFCSASNSAGFLATCRLHRPVIVSANWCTLTEGFGARTDDDACEHELWTCIRTKVFVVGTRTNSPAKTTDLSGSPRSHSVLIRGGVEWVRGRDGVKMSQLRPPSAGQRAEVCGDKISRLEGCVWRGFFVPYCSWSGFPTNGVAASTSARRPLHRRRLLQQAES